jgi:hypothetical protein
MAWFKYLKNTYNIDSSTPTAEYGSAPLRRRVLLDNLQENIEENENSVNNSIQRIVNNKGSVDGIIPFFQKRSGDWLQALSTLQRFRSYNPYPIKGIPILVTIDQPFLAYALRIGVNVLFCQGENASNNIEKSFIFFYNNSATREENPLESFKLFFKNTHRYSAAIIGKDILINNYNKILNRITDYLNNLLEKINAITNLIIENDIKKFNKLYVTYHLLLIKKIILTKNFKQFIEEPYKSLIVEPIDLQKNSEGNILDLHKKESFVINVESYINKYNEDYVKTEISNLEKLFNDYTKSVKIETFVFLDFGRLFTYEHITSDTFYLQKIINCNYYPKTTLVGTFKSNLNNNIKLSSNFKITSYYNSNFILTNNFKQIKIEINDLSNYSLTCENNFNENNNNNNFKSNNNNTFILPNEIHLVRKFSLVW